MSDVQTERTNLAVVEESTLNAFTPPTTGWRNLQPNTYGAVGSTTKKVPRDPISNNLQLRKGMLTDLDSMVPFEHDITKDLIDRFGEAIFRCATKHSGGTGQSRFTISSVDGTGYVVAADGATGGLQQRTLVMVRGCPTESNNGLKLVGAGSGSTHVAVSGTVAEAVDADIEATLEVAGFRFATSDLVMDTDGNFTSTVADFSTMGLNEEQWVVLSNRTDDAGIYALATADYEGAAMVVSIAAHKLTLARRTWDQYAYLDLAAVAGGNVDTVIEAIDPGADGQDITVAIVADSGTAAGSLTESGSAVTLHVKTSATATTVAQLEALIDTSTLIRVKTPDATGSDAVLAGDVFAATNLHPQAPDTGAGKTVEVYWTKWYRNLPANHDDFKKPSFAFEIAYPDLGDDGETEYEYALGNMLDEFTWNLPLTGKATANLSFVGCRTRKPTSTRITGPSTALDPNTDSGVSTSTDIQRLRVSGADEAGITTDFISLKIVDKNGITPQKQLGKLGARLLNQGKHTCMVDADLIFTDADVIRAVRDNRDGCLDVLMRNEDFGCLLDVQRLTLDTNDRKFEKDKIMSISSKMSGFQNKLSTDSLSVFAWLPELPEEDE
jgi:hypothetical protein